MRYTLKADNRGVPGANSLQLTPAHSSQNREQFELISKGLSLSIYHNGITRKEALGKIHGRKTIPHYTVLEKIGQGGRSGWVDRASVSRNPERASG